MSGCAGRNSAARSNFCDGRSICSGVNCDCCLAGNGIQFCRSGFTEIEVTIAVKLENGRLSVRERQEGTISNGYTFRTCGSYCTERNGTLDGNCTVF